MFIHLERALSEEHPVIAHDADRGPVQPAEATHQRLAIPAQQKDQEVRKIKKSERAASEREKEAREQ